MAKARNITDRLQELMKKIKDKEVRKIVEEVVDIEISYRSSSRKNFPIQKIRDVIEGHVKNTD